MNNLYEIRADFDRDSIIVYQAYRKEIGENALKHQQFVPPFSMNRMTWIKPSFLWMMERSNWGLKKGQEYILGVMIKREAWETALKMAVLTSPESRVYRSGRQWQEKFDKAKIHVQWDPERSIRGKKLNYSSIQVGISRHLIQEYVKDWTVEIIDYRPLVRKIHKLCIQGEFSKAKKFLPKEKLYPTPQDIKSVIGASM